MMVFDWILNARNIDYFRRHFLFSDKKQNRYLIINLLSFFRDIIFFRDINFHAIIVEKQLLKHDILTHCRS